MAPSIGGEWLKEKFKLNSFHLTHSSYISSRASVEIDENGSIIECYPAHYAPAPNSLLHLEFYIKYDDLNFDFLKAVFLCLNKDEIEAYIHQKPRGKYERRIGFLYEFLTGQLLHEPDTGTQNYCDLLDDNKYVTGKAIKNSRWRINDNLLGTPEFCPIIRKTKHIRENLSADFHKLITEVTAEFPPDIYFRAVNYLFTKETRSSFQIEKEQPSQDRILRFVALLEKAGMQSTDQILSESGLTNLQNEIVDARYAAKGFRDFQNYIGQTTYNNKEIIHYVCPPPLFVSSMMKGLQQTAKKSEGTHPITRAAIIAFGFVYAHPFEDGNGRLHRFLIHDILTRDKLVQNGMIIPVSAHLVDNMKDYDKALEVFSATVLSRIRYELKSDNTMMVTNPEQVEACFRYPDLTEQVVYLAKTIKDTITEDIFLEMDFLSKYDEVKATIQEIVDMPDKKLDLLIRFLQQNKGVLAARKRHQFAEISESELSGMEIAFKEIFQLS